MAQSSHAGSTEAVANRVPPRIRRLAIEAEAEAVRPPHDPTASIHGRQWKLTDPSEVRQNMLPEGVEILTMSCSGHFVWVGER